jgi:hypothetical protein
VKPLAAKSTIRPPPPITSTTHTHTRAHTHGGLHTSNHCRATAVASRQLGLTPHVILRTSEATTADPGLLGNLVYERMVRGPCHFAFQVQRNGTRAAVKGTAFVLSRASMHILDRTHLCVCTCTHTPQVGAHVHMVSKADYTRVGSDTLLAKFAASLPSHPYVANPNSLLCVYLYPRTRK